MLKSIFGSGGAEQLFTAPRRWALRAAAICLIAPLGGCSGSMTDNGSVANVPLIQSSQTGTQASAEKTFVGKSGALASPTLASMPPTGPLVAASVTKDRPQSATQSQPSAQLKGPSASKAAETMTASATPGNSAYKVGALDVLDISVYKAPDLSKSVQVADSGTVNLPLIDDVQAVGRTAQEIERDIATRLGSKYLQKPQVTVFVKEYNSQRVTIEGAVKKPGVYPIRGSSSLLQFIAMAEGLDQISDSTVLVFRTTDGKRSAAKFDINDIRAGTAPDPSLQSGDVIVAPTSTMKEVFNNLMKVVPLANVFALL
jgi:polysaccharide biosynthesis/export protein